MSTWRIRRYAEEIGPQGYPILRTGHILHAISGATHQDSPRYRGPHSNFPEAARRYRGRPGPDITFTLCAPEPFPAG